MFVPSYQMHNVLNVFSKKLKHKKTIKGQNTSGKPNANRVNLTSEGKRRATIEKVSKEIFDKIIRFGSQANSLNRESEQIKLKRNAETTTAKTKKVEFVFNVIDTINKKTTNQVSVEDSTFLIQRLERLSKDTMDTDKRNTGFEDQGEITSPVL